MNDFEVDVFDDVARAVLAAYPKAFVSSEHVDAPAHFPAVSVVESANVTDRSGEDSSGVEVRSAVTYTVNAYCNSQESAKADAKRIMAIVSARMRRMNMTRLTCLTVDNARDPTVYRMVATYTGLVDAEGTAYRR